VSGRDTNPQDPKFGHAPQDGRIHCLAAIPLADVRGDLALGKVAYHPLNHPMLVLELEVHDPHLWGSPRL
jgi:hypothetical protein